MRPTVRVKPEETPRMLIHTLLLPLRRWRERMQQRRAVADIDSHTLRDLGLNRLELNAALNGRAVAPARNDAN